MANAHRQNLSVERIEAVDGSDRCSQAAINGIRKSGAGLSDAEAACILSHRKAWEALLSSAAEHLAIFEDDAHLSDDIRQLLASDQMPANAGLIKLETPTGKVSFARKACAPFGGRHLHQLITRAYGAGGYIVSRKCAQRLLELSQACEQPVDVILFDDASPIWDEFPVLQVIPAASIQDSELSKLNKTAESFASTIEHERKSAKVLRKTINQKHKKKIAFKKLRRYLHCVVNGANPFHYWSRVPLDLGSPKHTPDS